MLYDNIMIPYDGSASSKAALAEAVRFAKDDPGLTLRIVQIIDTCLLYTSPTKGRRPHSSPWAIASTEKASTS